MAVSRTKSPFLNLLQLTEIRSEIVAQNQLRE
jgi:hypothetical protein